MNDMIIGILINVLAAPVIFFLGALCQRRLAPAFARRRLALRPLLPFTVGRNDPLILTYGYVKPTGDGQQYAIEQSDLMALLRAYQFTARLRPSEQIRILDAYSL